MINERLAILSGRAGERENFSFPLFGFKDHIIGGGDCLGVKASNAMCDLSV